MLKSILSSRNNKIVNYLLYQKHTFLTNSYACPETWVSRFDCPIIKKVNLEEFYNSLDQNYSNNGVISAIDVDIFANSIKNANYLNEMRDLLHKLRLSADTINTLESTHHAAIRNYLDYGTNEDLINILKDPLNYGVFMDDYTANMLLDKLITLNEFEKAAVVATRIMLQEDYSNEITCSLCQYACYKYISTYKPIVQTEEPETKPKKVEVVKVRVAFLRNPYFDDHFDLNDLYLSSGKTLAWMSESKTDNLNVNLELLGWLVYKKYEKMLKFCEATSVQPNVKLYKETIDLMGKECEKANAEDKDIITKCMKMLQKLTVIDDSIEEALKINIENAINKRQNKDIEKLKQLLGSWGEIRQEKLVEQTNRLDRAKFLQTVEEKQKQMQLEEQRLWFFENEDKIDLEIESKEELFKDKKSVKSKVSKDDEDYIPPEIVPKRK